MGGPNRRPIGRVGRIVQSKKRASVDARMGELGGRARAHAPAINQCWLSDG
ncbi:hypothetical protein MGWOODY_Smn2768 [hydrothermal vent metagenome]|uniref:Uncharacterized protein n=1 Tax=hydrothermal vent metagenome TaxID=652676 RepID=A0A161KCP6_9ZZZZ